MNNNQRSKIEDARRESIEKSYCIDATGRHSAGYIVNSKREFDALEREQESQMSRDNQTIHTMPMYQKDGVS